MKPDPPASRNDHTTKDGLQLSPNLGLPATRRSIARQDMQAAFSQRTAYEKRLKTLLAERRQLAPALFTG